MRELELSTLGEQYLRQARKVCARIRALRCEMVTAPLSDLPELERRIMALYAEHNQLQKVGVYLQTYYDRKPHKVCDFGVS